MGSQYVKSKHLDDSNLEMSLKQTTRNVMRSGGAAVLRLQRAPPPLSTKEYKSTKLKCETCEVDYFA